MDIEQLETFLNYKIDTTIHPQDLVNTLILKAKQYLPDSCEETIQKTYEFANNAHKGQMRLSGEKYIIHPLKSTLILMDLHPDIQSIQSCLLHDVVEDTYITQQDIEREFGEDIAKLCEGLVKVSKIKYKGEDIHLETLKKTFLAMAQDLRVIFIKLADRIHNIQTLHFHPKENKRKNIATETMKIYVQIAKRLGLYQYQVTLENACFKILHPEEYNDITNYLKKNFSLSNKYIQKGTSTILKFLQKEGLENLSIKGRIKSPYRIREKMEYKYQTKNIENIMDVLAFRIITNNISDCYRVLGIIHKYYTPLIKKIKDYIALPKFNGYKSIHTTILGMFKFPIEIQIRTNQMDEIAEYGVAAHYAYSDIDKSSKKQKINKKQEEWIKNLQQLVNTYTKSKSKEGFKDKLNIEIFNKETFVYTPKGDIIEIPKGSTVLDFAFHIHTEIGLKFKNAIVNGEIVQMTYIPNTGDIIKINTFRYKYTATRQRISILKTPSAKAKVSKYIKTKQYDELIERSTTILNTKLKKLKLPLLNSKDNKINKIYNKKELNNKLIDALENKGIYNDILKSIYQNEYKTYINKGINQKSNITENVQTTHTKTQNIIIDEDKLLNYSVCPECQPSHKDKIIAKTGKSGLKIHSLSCRAMKTVSPGKLLEAHRKGGNANTYTITSTITASKDLNFIKILEIFDKFNITVLNFSIKDDDTSDYKIIKIIWEVKNPAQIELIYQHTKKYGKLIKKIKRSIQ